MERRTEELEITFENVKFGEVTAERQKIYVENCEKTIRKKVRSEYEEASYEDKKIWKEKQKS